MNYIKTISIIVLSIISTLLHSQDTAITDLQDTVISNERSESFFLPEKIKDSWELGFHTGHFLVDGDVDKRLPSGYGIGLHLRKAIHYTFSLRADVMFGESYGLDPQMWAHSSKGGGLVENVFLPYQNQDGWFPKYRTRYGHFVAQTIFNIGNLLYLQDKTTWSTYFAVGAGIKTHSTMLDLLDNDGKPYANLSNFSGDLDTRSGRNIIKDKIESIYDGNYETQSWKKVGIYKYNDKFNFMPVFTASLGFSKKINDRMNLSFEHQVNLSDDDSMDGIRFRTAFDQSNSNDVSHYTNIRLGINLGNRENRTEPLYWLNPLNPL